MRALGNRIAIVGVSASGKSTFARKLAAKTGLPLTHIDAVMWKPGWEYIGDEATVERLKEISACDSWIIEGYIEKGAFEAVLGRADTILFLDYPRHLAAWRYVRRWLAHRKTPRPELVGSPEKFSFSFLKLVWEKRETYHLHKFTETMTDSEKIQRLRTPVETSGLLASI